MATPAPFSFNTLVIAFLSFVQNVSALCIMLMHTYKRAIEVVKMVNAEAAGRKETTSESQHYSSNILFCASEILDAKSRMACNALFYLLDAGLAFGESLADR